MDRPRDDTRYTPSTEYAPVAEDADKARPDLFGEHAGQSQSATEQSQNLGNLTQTQSGNAFASTAGLTGNLNVQEGIQPSSEIFDNAADAFVPETITERTPETKGTTSDPSEPNAVDAVTIEGKRVFSPHELNQAGEDKEYFHPDKGHRFDAPKDANDHALTPDIEVKPDNTIGRVD